MLVKLNAARATNSFDRRFQALVRIPLSITDDFVIKPLRPTHDGDFHHLVAVRYERGTTVLTSNLDFAEWGMRFQISCSAPQHWIDCDKGRTASSWMAKAIVRLGRWNLGLILRQKCENNITSSDLKMTSQSGSIRVKNDTRRLP